VFILNTRYLYIIQRCFQCADVLYVPETKTIGAIFGALGCVSGGYKYIDTGGDLKEAALYTVGGALVVPLTPLALGGQWYIWEPVVHKKHMHEV